jgi:AcrR family transcriptional regulator
METPPDTSTTRARVRQAALELFGEKGYDGASMSELAERVGVAKPSLYNYYRSKDDLLLDLVEEGLRLWVEACMAPFHRGGTFESQLAEHLRLTVEFAHQRPNVVGIFHLATTHVQGELAQRVEILLRAKEGAIRQLVLDRIEEAIASGELRCVDAVSAHAFLTIFFHGILFLQSNSGHEVGPMREHLDGVWRILYRGLSGREANGISKP